MSDVVFRPGSRLERDARRWQTLPRVRVTRWAPERLRDDCRPPHPRKGQKPANHGLRFPPTPCTPSELVEVLAAFPHTILGARNRALAVVLWRAGLRVSEGLSLMPEDVDFDNGLVTVRCGKGGKRRLSGIDRGALAEVNGWMLVRSLAGFDHTQPLFPVLEGKTKGGLLRQSYFRTVLHKAARDAGISKRVAPHQLRHAHACELAREGVDIYAISKQLGHGNLGTTTTYLAGIAPTEVAKVTMNRGWGA